MSGRTCDAGGRLARQLGPKIGGWRAALPGVVALCVATSCHAADCGTVKARISRLVHAYESVRSVDPGAPGYRSFLSKKSALGRKVYAFSQTPASVACDGPDAAYSYKDDAYGLLFNTSCRK